MRTESVKVIRPKSGLVPVDFAELGRYRDLLWMLTMRTVLVRYKQTALGVLWAVIQPIVTVAILTVIFGRLAKLPSEGVPYPVMILAGLLPWQFFSQALSQGSESVVGAQAMVQKIYFPRLFIPLSATLSAVADLLISLGILVVLMLWYQIPIRPHLLLIPLFSLLAFVAALGASLWFSALNVKYRDIKHLVPFVVRVGMYLSPVAFMSSIIPERWQFWYNLNPLVGVIDGFRWAILGDRFEPYWQGFTVSLVVVAAIFVSGLYFFRYTERTFADMV